MCLSVHTSLICIQARKEAKYMPIEVHIFLILNYCALLICAGRWNNC